MSERTLNCTAAGGEAVIETNVLKSHGNLTRGGSYILDQYGGETQGEYPKPYPDSGAKSCKLSSSVTRSSGLHEFDLL